MERTDGPAGQRETARSSLGQRSLIFDTPRSSRDDTRLFRSLTSALAVHASGEARAPALIESLEHAMAGLGAGNGALVRVRHELPVDVEPVWISSRGSEAQSASAASDSSPGLDTTFIRATIEAGRPLLLKNSQGNLESRSLVSSGTGNVLCAPVSDSLTGGTIAVLCFESEATRTFDTDDLNWITAYAAALRQALALYFSDQDRPHGPKLQSTGTQDDGAPELVGDSEATRRLRILLNTLLPSTARPDAPPIFVAGESGTGKEVVARYLHHHSRKRSRGPFRAVNCAGLSGELLESKLFGHRKGAFTGAVADSPGLFRAADKGVLFLDEIGEMPPEGQALLLRALETRTVQALGETRETPVDVQLILATNRSLEDEVAAKRFREDLYYRVSGLRVELRPLRDASRIADIRPLLGFSLAKHERLLNKKTMGLTRAAFHALLQYAWPGNVRQLNNVCMCLVTHAAPGAWIDVADIQALRPEVLAGPKSLNPKAYLEDERVTYGEAIRIFRRTLILDRLSRYSGRAAEAAASLGISEPTFYRYWSDAKRLS